MLEYADLLTMHPRSQIVEIINRIYKRRLTTTSGGNISVIDDNGNIWITPSGVDKGSLSPSDIMCVRADGSIEGKHKPSSEYPFHRAIYKRRPDIKAVIHAHPPGLVAFSIVRKIPDTNTLSQAKFSCGAVGYAPYALPGSEELGKEIAHEFEKGFDSVIMENHGTVVGGSDLDNAFQRFETLESVAVTLLNAGALGQSKPLSEEEIHDYHDKTQAMNLPELDHVEHSPEELDLREKICKIVRRSCEQGLMISSYGIVSARLKGNDFLITPKDKSRWEFQPNDIIQIKGGKREPGKTPSRMTLIHQKIYEQNPEVNSIIVSQPNYVMAFGCTGKTFNVRTIPESWIFLQDIPILPFHTLINKEEQILTELQQRPSVIISNNSYIVTGKNLLQTFDYLEVAEFSAKSLVMGSALGALIPINDEQVEDLRKKFIG
ncbi:MAG TPA: class II aldolase/adducin family protein [Niabella sp.]|nr:class II aldolase/adducin family protein [Niabella sp.]